ncbi:MAG: hypothetical protein ABSA39_14005 [Edaphobacter sp.]
MERERVRGRFVRTGLDGDGGARTEAKTSASKAPKAKHCRTFTRERVAEALPEIVKTFVEEAKKGSIAHTKMLTTLSGLDKGDKGNKAAEMQTGRKRRGKSSAVLMMEKILREPEQ